MPEPLKKETFEAARDPPKNPLEMTSRSVPPPVPVVPDQFQMWSGRFEAADSEAKVSTPLVTPKSMTRAPTPPASVMAPRVSMTAPESCSVLPAASREMGAVSLIRFAADPLSNSAPPLILTALVAVRAPDAPDTSRVPALTVVAPV